MLLINMLQFAREAKALLIDIELERGCCKSRLHDDSDLRSKRPRRLVLHDMKTFIFALIDDYRVTFP